MTILSKLSTITAHLIGTFISYSDYQITNKYLSGKVMLCKEYNRCLMILKINKEGRENPTNTVSKCGMQNNILGKTSQRLG